ncbi:MAG TPA: hypothetical protein VJI73_02945 [Candidatus Paceibacterota bacterium]
MNLLEYQDPENRKLCHNGVNLAISELRQKECNLGVPDSYWNGLEESLHDLRMYYEAGGGQGVPNYEDALRIGQFSINQMLGGK